MTSRMMKYDVRNTKTGQILVILEPWVEEFILPPGGTLSINILSERMGLLETEIGADSLTVWLWGGCRAEVYLDGKDVTVASLSISAPG